MRSGQPGGSAARTSLRPISGNSLANMVGSRLGSQAALQFFPFGKLGHVWVEAIVIHCLCKKYSEDIDDHALRNQQLRETITTSSRGTIIPASDPKKLRGNGPRSIYVFG